MAFSPLARGFLTNKLHDTSGLAEHDLRLTIPRFDAENYPANLLLLPAYVKLAQRQGCTPAQLALAWVIAQGDNVIAIPGTHNLHHLEENIGANNLELDAEVMAQLNALINQHTVHGERYGDRAQASVTTEQFGA